MHLRLAAWALVCGALSGCMAAASEPARAADPPPTRVRVTTAKALDRECVLLAVFDLHTAADSEDKGFEELRRHAAELGADAVIGAESNMAKRVGCRICRVWRCATPAHRHH